MSRSRSQDWRHWQHWRLLFRLLLPAARRCREREDRLARRGGRELVDVDGVPHESPDRRLGAPGTSWTSYASRPKSGRVLAASSPHSTAAIRVVRVGEQRITRAPLRIAPLSPSCRWAAVAKLTAV